MLPERCPVVLTGATGGIGHEIASELARTGIDMILPCRNETKFHALEQTLKAINPAVSLQFIPLDLNRADSVREAAAMLKDTPLAGVLNNAGIMCRSFTLSPDGPETTLNVNYFNTRLLNELLLEQVKPGGALVFTTSLTRLFGVKKNLPETVTAATFSQLGTYALSKKLLTRYAMELAPRAKARGVKVNLCDPGVVDTGIIAMDRWFDPLADIFFRPFIRSAANGARPALRALFAPAADSPRIYTLRRTHLR